MKRLLLALLVGASQVTAMADDYQYLAFQTSDNTVTTVSVNGLVLTVDGTRLVATTADGEQTFTLSDLSKMFFTNDGPATGIADVQKADDETVSVYNTTGVRLGAFSSLDAARQQLPAGVYIVKKGNSTFKTVVR